MMVTAFGIAQRFVGIKEIKGTLDNPLIMAMLRLDNSWPSHDEVPWCSAFVNWVTWLLRLPRSKSLSARSWLAVGAPVRSVSEAQVGFDIVVLKRGEGDQPGPESLSGPGHVGFFAGTEQRATGEMIVLLGGNQGDSVGLAAFPTDRLLGIRRLA